MMTTINKTTVKKTTALILCLLLAFALGATALASDSDLTYFTSSPNTDWTEIVTQGNSVTLQAGPADSSYVFSGFSTQAAAQNVSWTVNTGSALISSTSQSTLEIETDVWVSTLTINAVNNDYGAISVKATNTNSGAAATAYADFTVVVEASSTVSAVTNIQIEVADIHYVDSYMYVYDDGLTVQAADASGGTFDDVSGAAQSYPTAADALDKILDATFTGTQYVVPEYIKAINQSYAYISSIQAYDWYNDDYPTLAPYMNGNYDWVGWHYCVIRDGSIVAASDYIGAAALPLESGDEVYWAFGTDAEADYYFPLLED